MHPSDNISLLTDEELAGRFRLSGKSELVGELFRRHTRFVFLVCMKYLGDEEQARDATMQVFENLFRGLKKQDIKTFRPWLHTVAKNHCLMQLRSSKQMLRVTEEIKKEAAADMETGYLMHQEDDDEHQLKKMEDAILMLNKEQSVCIELFYLKRMRYQEIAEMTGNTFEQVKSHIQNGKRNLKIHMSRRNE